MTYCANTALQYVMRLSALPIALLVAMLSSAHAADDESLREAAQNPIADMISVPFQNDTNFNVGNTSNTQNILNLQPVIPFSLGDSWNVIVRPVLPVIYQPSLELPGAEESVFGLGDLTPEIFFSPKKPIDLAPGINLVWGVGPVFQLPTATDDVLGTGKWSAGPGFVTFLSVKPLHITTGFLAFNVWSFAGDSDRPDVNAMTLQPFLNYNLNDGWYLTTAPLITADWEADSDNRWTVPVGGGVGRIFKIQDQPVNLQLSAYYNAVTPDDTGAEWNIRAQLTFLFPK